MSPGLASPLPATLPSPGSTYFLIPPLLTLSQGPSKEGRGKAMVREGWDLKMPQPSLSPFTHLVLYRVGGECCPAYQAIWIPTRQLWETVALPAVC